jgi:hypothetical protein
VVTTVENYNLIWLFDQKVDQWLLNSYNSRYNSTSLTPTLAGACVCPWVWVYVTACRYMGLCVLLKGRVLSVLIPIRNTPLKTHILNSMKFVFLHTSKFYFVSVSSLSTDIHPNARWQQNRGGTFTLLLKVNNYWFTMRNFRIVQVIY